MATFDGTPLGAVIRLDDDGRPESDFRFYTDKIYRVVVVDADGVVVKTIDGVAIPEGEGGGMYNPMTAAGDVIVGGTGGVAERLAAGSEGYAFKIVNGVPKWAPDAEGMQNPMTTAGDLIVGNTDGTPDRLGIGTDGDILATASGAPTWEGGPKKYRNVYQNIPSPQIDDGYLGCLFYLSGSAQALTLPSSANIPSKAFIDFVFLDDTATLTITPQGTTTLNEQATAVTIGGQSATLYRLTFLGHCGSGDEWALGGSGNGDHKVSADGTDTAGYLEDKLGEGSGISLAKSGGKIVFSVTGGGGGGGDWTSICGLSSHYLQSSNAYVNVYFTFTPLGPSVRSILIPYAHFSYSKNVTAKIAVWKCGAFNGGVSLGTPIAEKTFTQAIKHPLTWFDFDADVDVSDKTANYIFGYSTNSPDNGNVKIICDDSSADNNFGLVSYQMKSNNSWDNTYPLWYGGKRSMAFGLSSAAQNS